MALLDLLHVLRRRWLTALLAFVLAAAGGLLAATLLPSSAEGLGARLEFQPVAATPEDALRARTYIENQLHPWSAALTRDEVVDAALRESGSPLSPAEARARLTTNMSSVNVIDLTLRGRDDADAALLTAWAKVGCQKIVEGSVTTAGPIVRCVPNRAERLVKPTIVRDLNVPLALLLALALAGLAVAAHEALDARVGGRPVIRRGTAELPLLATVGRRPDGWPLLRSALAASPARVVSLAGPAGAAVASRLAESLEAAGERVAVWDDDEIARRAGLPAGATLEDAAASPALAAAVADDPHDHLLLATDGSPATTRALAGVADTTVLAAGRDERRRGVEERFGVLLDVDAPVAGLVIHEPARG